MKTRSIGRVPGKCKRDEEPPRLEEQDRRVSPPLYYSLHGAEPNPRFRQPLNPEHDNLKEMIIAFVFLYPPSLTLTILYSPFRATTI